MDAQDWANLTDEELQEKRIRQLNLRWEGTEVEPLVRQFYHELTEKGLIFQSPCFVGDEWFCPAGIPAIFVPFFLLHDRLRRLERKMVLEVEGETPDWFMKLIRHEAGHAYSYAYRLYRRKKWQAHFGLASTEETEFYRPRPYSRSYVVHLDDWYAQSHPDEDFAETFAVWLTPGLDWRTQYRDWKALEKLEYVDSLMRSLAGVPPLHQPVFRHTDYDCLNVKLKTYYRRKRRLYEDAYPDFYDADLRRIFNAARDVPGAQSAASYLRRHRRQIMEEVCRWTNERKYRVTGLLNRLVNRCDALDLHVQPGDVRLPLSISAHVTTLVMNHLFTGRFKRNK
jgi:hypothetical protein